MAALASMSDDRPVRGRKSSTGPASAVDLLTRLGVALPEPEGYETYEREPLPPLWDPVETEPNAFTRLRAELAEGRRHGFAFDEAWPLAVERAHDVLSGGDSRARWVHSDFNSVLYQTRYAWRAAYDRTGDRIRYLDALAMYLS